MVNERYTCANCNCQLTLAELPFGLCVDCLKKRREEIASRENGAVVHNPAYDVSEEDQRLIMKVFKALRRIFCQRNKEG